MQHRSALNSNVQKNVINRRLNEFSVASRLGGKRSINRCARLGARLNARRRLIGAERMENAFRRVGNTRLAGRKERGARAGKREKRARAPRRNRAGARAGGCVKEHAGPSRSGSAKTERGTGFLAGSPRPRLPLPWCLLPCALVAPRRRCKGSPSWSHRRSRVVDIWSSRPQAQGSPPPAQPLTSSRVVAGTALPLLHHPHLSSP